MQLLIYKIAFPESLDFVALNGNRLGRDRFDVPQSNEIAVSLKIFLRYTTWLSAYWNRLLVSGPLSDTLYAHKSVFFTS